MNVYIIFGRSLVGIFEITNEINAILIDNEQIAKYHKFIFDIL